MALLLVIPVLAGVRLERPRPQSGPRFFAAIHVDSGHVTVALDSFRWRESAPPELRELEDPGWRQERHAELLDHADDYGAQFGFGVPLPDSLRSVHYLLIHAFGGTSLHPDSLHGTARFPVSDSGPAISPVQYLGELHASTPGQRGLTGGGFVLISARPLRITTSTSHHTAEELLARQVPDYLSMGAQYWAIAAQFEFRLDHDPSVYLFVQWAPDTEQREAGCEFRFELLRLGPTPEMLAASDYGCDV